MRLRSIAGLVFSCAVAGCGVYSVDLDPPPTRADGLAAAPLDLSISLGDVRSVANGHPEPLRSDVVRAIDADFVRAVGASGIFRDALPHGRSADVYVDMVRELHAAPMTPGRTAYLLAVAPLAFLVPGFPHPWDYTITRTVKLRGDVAGTAIPLPEREQTYEERIWGANYWGGLSVDPLRQSEAEYLATAVGEIVASARPLFERFAAAVQEGDVEQAWLASVAAGLATH